MRTVTRYVMAIFVTVVLAGLALAGCSTGGDQGTGTAVPSEGTPGTPTQGPVEFGARPVNPACSGNQDDPQPGDVICFTDDLDDRLEINTGGTPEQPIVYSGNGDTRVPGIRVEADNVVVQGFISDEAKSTGIFASGENVVVQDNVVTQVNWVGEDVDAIRFFGNGVQILHNTVYDLEGSDDIGESHVDCIQTYATSGPGSSNVVIQGNRCEGIRAQCLMAEGPNDEGGSGEGVSRNWLFDGNYCEANAKAQSVAFEDIQDVVISNNTMAGEGNKAIALGKNSTGIIVRDNNTIGEGYGRAVGFDDPSAQEGYEGPPAR